MAGIDNAFLYGCSCKRIGISYSINVTETRQAVVDMCFSILLCSLKNTLMSFKFEVVLEVLKKYSRNHKE